MLFQKNIFLITLLSIVLLCWNFAIANTYIAFSLNEAERQLQNGSTRPELIALGGITQPVGVIYDKEKNDLIILGQVNPNERSIALDDFMVAARAILKNKTWPLVSIDPIEKTKDTKIQKVRLEGGISSTQFGKDLFNADVTLKKIGLGEIGAEVWGIKSYFDLLGDYWGSTDVKGYIQSRFWFKADKDASSFADREAVVVIEQLNVKVNTEKMYASLGKTDVATDQAGDQFARDFSMHYADISEAFPEVKRVRVLFKLVGLATGIQKLALRDDKINSALNYWLNEYNIAAVETPKEFPLITRSGKIGNGNAVRKLDLDGGIELKSLLLELKDGTLSALRDIVIKSRPENIGALIWEVPLYSWHNPAEEAEMRTDEDRPKFSGRYPINSSFGCTMGARIGTGDNAHAFDFSKISMKSSAFSNTVPNFKFAQMLSPPTFSPQVGGVMLSNVASIAGAEGVDLTGGNFALVVDGERAQLEPNAFRKFITALWAVYYSKKDPGISIDPIAPESKKHMVRYIGRVVNSDLGRVMREADYIMKKWAVGTEKPDITGFKSPDGFSATMGLNYVGASSRFWFVPQDMTFSRGGNALLFDHGRMTVKTEYIYQDKKAKAEPSNEAFAKFFTDHYDEISAKYPVYGELFEYSKHVSLAKFLRESGVPLMWFLIANKELMLTEDSPGTVDELAKGSDYWKNIYIKGGVDLNTQGRYVYDAEAVKAINAALAGSPSISQSKTSLGGDAKGSGQTPSQPFSFNYAKKSYSVVPQHSLTSGKDFHGIRYQTDIALRSDSMPGLELVRYFNPAKPEGGEFGNGWRLLIPYRVHQADTIKRDFLNARVPVRMVMEDLLHGGTEVLTFSTDRYSAAGWVPDQLAKSQVVGLFLISDASFRLQDKIGNQFWFDQAGNCTDMILSQSHHIKIEHIQGKVEELDTRPYVAAPEGKDSLEYNMFFLSKRMRVTNVLSGYSETFAFSDTGDLVGWQPEKSGGKFKFLAFLSNGGAQLVDNYGNDIVFYPDGRFKSILPPNDEPLPKNMSMGSQKIIFSYTLDGQGRLRISRARLFDVDKRKKNDDNMVKPYYYVKYDYDDEGRLCNAKGSDGRLGWAPEINDVLWAMGK
jgi:hypothetical protein